MSHPFILWTLQRTGGTTLADSLMALSEHPAAEHEPFNWSRDRARVFSPVVAAWRESGDAAALATALAGIVAKGTLLKHCHDLFPMAFNLALLEAAARAGYRHLLLLRENEGARLLSKFIAESQGTWFDDHARDVYAAVEAGRRDLRPVPVDQAVAQFRHARAATAALREAFARHGIAPAEVTFESLYGPDRAVRSRTFGALLEHLGFPPEGRAAQAESFLDGTARDARPIVAVLDRIPNVEAVVEGLAAAGCPTPAGLAVKGLVRALAADLARHAAARGWIFEANLDQRWPGLSFRFGAESSLAFRLESADASFGNVYFGIRNRDAMANKSLDEALCLALGRATNSDTWPWCRHPDAEDDILPIAPDWGAGDALCRGVADGSAVTRILAAADRFRTALIGSGFLAAEPAEWARSQDLPAADAGAPLPGAAAAAAQPRPRFAAGYLAGLGLSAETILDVGVGHGTPELYAAFPDRRFVLVDPRWGGETLLDVKPRRYRFVAKAAGRGPGRAWLGADGAKSSLVERTALTASADPVKRYEVEVTTLDAILDDLAIEGGLGIKIDAEGYETEVLAGLVRHRARVEWVICEASIRDRFVGGYDFGDLVAALREGGFRFFNVLSRFERRPLLYDVLFLRRDHPLFA